MGRDERRAWFEPFRLQIGQKPLIPRRFGTPTASHQALKPVRELC